MPAHHHVRAVSEAAPPALAAVLFHAVPLARSTVPPLPSGVRRRSYRRVAETLNLPLRPAQVQAKRLICRQHTVSWPPKFTPLLGSQATLEFAKREFSGYYERITLKKEEQSVHTLS